MMKNVKLNDDDIKMPISALYEIGNCDSKVLSLIDELKTQTRDSE